MSAVHPGLCWTPWWQMLRIQSGQTWALPWAHAQWCESFRSLPNTPVQVSPSSRDLAFPESEFQVHLNDLLMCLLYDI